MRNDSRAEQQELREVRLWISETEPLGYPVGTAEKREDVARS